VEFRKVIRRTIRNRREGIDIAADTNIVVHANISASRANHSSDPRAEAPEATPPAEPGNRKEEQRMTQKQEYQRLTREQLDELVGEPLPEKAAMSLVNANLAIPINAAIAANVLSDGSIAYADAAQITPIDQSNL
jgi:hypothetical protein